MKRTRNLPTVNDLIDRAPGYAASGESKYSRAAANGAPRDLKLSPKFNHRIRPGRPLTDAEKILDHKNQIRWLRCEMQAEGNPARRARLQTQIDIKTRLLADLRGGSNG